MIEDTMVHGSWPRRPGPARIEQDTPIVPHAVASAVWEEAGAWLGEKLPREWLARLTERAEAVYASNARENEVSKQEATPLGTRWVVEGPMLLADGTVAGVRAVWFIEAGERTPRFVTAYPLKRSKQV